MWRPAPLVYMGRAETSDAPLLRYHHGFYKRGDFGRGRVVGVAWLFFQPDQKFGHGLQRERHLQDAPAADHDDVGPVRRQVHRVALLLRQPQHPVQAPPAGAGVEPPARAPDSGEERLDPRQHVLGRERYSVVGQDQVVGLEALELDEHRPGLRVVVHRHAAVCGVVEDRSGGRHDDHQHARKAFKYRARAAGRVRRVVAG